MADRNLELGPEISYPTVVSGSRPRPVTVTASPSESKEKTYFGYTKEKITITVIFALVNLFSGTIYSLQAPFYPKEAEAKGASATEYGFVLGVFQLVMFMTSPIFGIVIGIISPKLVFNAGIFVNAVCAILFGFLDYSQEHVTFITLSFLLRILQATGEAAFVTATFTLIAVQFPDSVATTFAFLETFWGLGLILGPGLGGALYELGGFILPFLFMGSCFFIIGIITYFILPEADRPVTLKEEKTTVFKMLRIPEVVLAFSSVIIAASGVGFLVATLEPHLRENFGITPGTTGLIFMIDGITYAVFAPLWGKLCDKSNQPKVFTVIGAVLTFTGFLFIGPAPFIPLNTILWLTCVGLFIHGLGTGVSYVSGFIQAMQGSVNNGLSDNVSTYGLVSGLFLSSLTLGMFLGSSIGGVLLDNFGFIWGSTYVLTTQVLIVFATTLFICLPNTFKLKGSESSAVGSSETESLLQNEHSFNEPSKSKLEGKSCISKSADYGAM